MRARILPVVALPWILLLPAATTALAADAAVRAAAARHLPRVAAAEPGIARGASAGTQAGYDAARDLDEAVRAAGPADRCGALARSARRYARAVVRRAERVDRLRAPGPPAVRARREAVAALAACVPGPARPARAEPSLAPGDGEAFLGAVVAAAPRGADAADVLVDGVPRVTVRVRAGVARAVVAAPPGRHDLRVRFRRGPGPVGASAASGVWLLPRSARAHAPAARTAPRASAALRRLGEGSGRVTLGLWTQDLATGSAAGWNARAPFPAASTVKLALVVDALASARGRARDAPLAYDLRQITGWSSNLAANRVMVALGGSEAGGAARAQAVLRRMGARSSTFTGGYLVGTAVGPPGADVRRRVPRVSGRVTTAADLARVLRAVHAAATGDRAARRATGLGTRRARLLVGMLLGSRQAGDNRSLVAGGAPAGSLVAQKNGWIRTTRLGAALVYAPAGPRIVVVLAHEPGGISPAAARAAGTRLARVDPSR